MRRSLGALLLILLTSACDDNGIRRERPDETFAGPDDIGAMADIPAGAFPMGCNGEKDGACDGDEFPYHIVSLSAYRIGKYEVTADEYAACVAAGDCVNTTSLLHYYLYDDNPYCNLGAPGRGKHPMQCVTWDGAWAYCAYAGKRLPTEAEWEKAARGTDGRIYPWGDEPPSCGRAVMDDPQAGGPGCGAGGTLPVGSRAAGASPYGVHDMAGNVWEWVNDIYGEDYYAVSPDTDPSGPDTGFMRVLRGGAWRGSDAADLRTSHRSGNYPAGPGSLFYGNFYGGFRCAE